jgi:hypothetical protein
VSPGTSRSAPSVPTATASATSAALPTASWAVDAPNRRSHRSRQLEVRCRLHREQRADTAWRLHVAGLVEAAGVAAEPLVLAEQLLAPLSPTLYHHERAVAGRKRDEIAAALAALANVLGAVRSRPTAAP